MEQEKRGKAAFLYLLITGILAIGLIVLNQILGMRIPFSVQFLIGFIGLLLVYVVWHAVLTKGWRLSLVMLGSSTLMAFTAEALGVNYGLIFGHYHYTQALGFSIFGVPLLAALAWEPIVYASFCLGDLLLPVLSGIPGISSKRISPLFLALLGALATTAWDMMIDPIAVSQGWWVWEDGGAYMPYVAHGVPIQNFIGWLLVAFTINLVYRGLIAWTTRAVASTWLSYYGPLTLYVALFATAFGVTVTILQHPEIALIGMLAMGPFIVIGLANLPMLVSAWRDQSATSLSS